MSLSSSSMHATHRRGSLGIIEGGKLCALLARVLHDSGKSRISGASPGLFGESIFARHNIGHCRCCCPSPLIIPPEDLQLQTFNRRYWFSTLSVCASLCEIINNWKCMHGIGLSCGFGDTPRSLVAWSDAWKLRGYDETLSVHQVFSHLLHNLGNRF